MIKKILLFLLIVSSFSMLNKVAAMETMNNEQDCAFILNSGGFSSSLFKTSSGGELGVFPVAFNTCISPYAKDEIFIYNYKDLLNKQVNLDYKDRIFPIGYIIQREKPTPLSTPSNTLSVYRWFEVADSPWHLGILKIQTNFRNGPAEEECFPTSSVLKVNHPEMTSPFIDIDQHFARPYIEFLYKYGIVEGKSPVLFSPDDSITRAEAAKIIVMSLMELRVEEIAKDYNTFLAHNTMLRRIHYQDVLVADWFAPFVYELTMNASLLDMQKDHFHPNDPITRAEFAKLAVWAKYLRKADCKNYNTIEEIEPWVEQTMNLKKEKSYFQDIPESSWMYIPVGYLRAYHFIDQKDFFFPDRNISRAEAAKIIVQLKTRSLLDE